MKKIIFISALVLTFTAMSQEYNPNSTKSIRKTDIMYKKTLVKALDLRESQNKSLMSKNNELTKTLIEAFRNGKLKGYTNDSLKSEVTLEEFEERMVIPGMNFEEQIYETYLGEYEEEVSEQIYKYGYNQLYQLEITEDLLFDKGRSVMYHDLQAITIYIPADLPDNIRGIQQHLVTFSYRDCVSIFEDDPQAIWFNSKNDREHINLSDAFELMLFHSYIVKVSNPDDSYIVDNYKTPQQGINASLQAEFELMEFEHNLWEQ